MQSPRIIIDYGNDTPDIRSNLGRHITHLQQYFKGTAQIEVMAYGGGLDLVLRSADMSDDVAALPATFIACQNTMARRGLDASALVTAQVAPSGLGHIVERQLQGWAYLKA